MYSFVDHNHGNTFRLFFLYYLCFYTLHREYRNEAEGMDAGSPLLIPPTYQGGGALRCIEFVIPAGRKKHINDR